MYLPTSLLRAFGVSVFSAAIASAAIYVEDFASYALGATPVATGEYNALVVDGTATIGSGNAMSLVDTGTTGATADKIAGFEFNFAADDASEYQAVSLSFDLFNNEIPGSASSMIFGVGGFSDSTGIALNSTSARFFNLEFSSTSTTLKVRTSDGSAGTIGYTLGASNTIELFINDDESGTINYERPDTATVDTLSANSMALFVNGIAFGETTMGALSVGESSGLGRFSFYSGTSVISGFTIDNLEIGDLGALAVIPEPGTLSAALGMIALAGFVRRRRR